MARSERMVRRMVRSAVLTLRMTNEEMLRFKLAALSMGKKRARIVRERVADLIGGAAAGEAGERAGATERNLPLKAVEGMGRMIVV